MQRYANGGGGGVKAFSMGTDIDFCTCMDILIMAVLLIFLYNLTNNDI